MSFWVGDRVVILSGAFAGQLGEIVEVPLSPSAWDYLVDIRGGVTIEVREQDIELKLRLDEADYGIDTYTVSYDSLVASLAQAVRFGCKNQSKFNTANEMAEYLAWFVLTEGQVWALSVAEKNR